MDLGDSAKKPVSNFFNKSNNLSSPLPMNAASKINANLTPGRLASIANTERPGSPKYASPLALKAAAMFKKVNKPLEKDDRENQHSGPGIKNDKRSKVCHSIWRQYWGFH